MTKETTETKSQGATAEKIAQQYVVLDETERSLTKPMSLGDARAWAESPLSTAAYKGLHIQPVGKWSSETKIAHTPGPWKVRIAHDDYTAFSIDGRPDSIEQAWANARLIAAAPELLNNLRSIVASLEIRLTAKSADQPAWDILNNARAAIAKAEGK